MSLSRAIYLSRRHLPAFAAQGFFWGAFAAYVPQIKAHIGASDGAFGLALLVSAIGAVSAMLVAPWVSARTGRYAIAVAAIAFALSFQAPLWVASVVPFAALMLFAGAGSGCLDVIMNARLTVEEARHKTSLMNLNHAAFSFAYAFSAITAGLVREAGVYPGWVFAFWGLVVIASSLMMIAPRVVEDEGAATVAPARMGSLIILGGLITLIGFLSENATEGWSALHIERTLGGGAAEGALGPAMLGLTMGFGRLSGQLIMGRLSEIKVLIGSAIVSGTGAFVAATAPAPGMAYLGFALLGLGVAVIAPMMLALAGQMADPARREVVISRVTVLGYFGFFIGPPLMGFVSQGFGLRASFSMVGILLWLVPVLVIALQSNHQKRAAP